MASTSRYALLDLNDCNLQLWHDDVHLESPGFALLQAAGYSFGAPALRSARLKPREIHTRYWWQLGTESLAPAFGTARHTADLAHAHLNTLHEQAQQPGEMLLSVPGSMTREQLSLLLGIVEACPFNAVGLVHRSVALATLYGSGAAIAHLELQLHQALLTQLLPEGDDLTVDHSAVLPGVGILQLQERLVEVAAAAFVRQTRFDPRRQAATEQQLYDALPGVLRALRQGGKATIDINGYSAHLERQDVAGVAQPLFDSAGKHLAGGQLIVDPLVGLLPALENALPGAQILQASDLQHAVDAHSDRLVQRGQSLDFVTRLPTLGLKQAPGADTAVAAAPFNAPTTPRATHLLQGHRARPLQREGTGLVGGWSLHRTEAALTLDGDGPQLNINGKEAAAGHVLQAGDTIEIKGEAHYTLICVQD